MEVRNQNKTQSKLYRISKLVNLNHLNYPKSCKIKNPITTHKMANLGIGSCTAGRVTVTGLGYHDQPLLKTQGICQLDLNVVLNFLNQPHFTINGAPKPSLCLKPGLIYRFNQNTLSNQKNPLNFSGRPDDPRASLPKDIELLYFVSGNRVTRQQYEFAINNYLQDNTYYIEFRVPEYARSRIFYYWSNNNRGMGSSIRIGGFDKPCKRGEQDAIPCNRPWVREPQVIRLNPQKRVTHRQPMAHSGFNWPLPPRPRLNNNA